MDGRTDGQTDGQTVLQRCDDASKNNAQDEGLDQKCFGLVGDPVLKLEGSDEKFMGKKGTMISRLMGERNHVTL